MTNGQSQLYDFGPFRVDAEERVLFRDGEVVPLAPKTFDTLLLLVRNSGRSLDKNALMRELWPDTFVEEANLAQQISLLRKSLGENAGELRYIETIPRRGYRFLPSVEIKPKPDGRSVADEPPVVSTERNHAGVVTRRRRVGYILAIAILLAFAGGSFVSRWFKPAANDQTSWIPLTAFEAAVQPSLSRDGRLLTFIRGENSFYGRGEIYVQMLPGGEARQLTNDGLPKMSPVFSPDGSRIAYTVVNSHFEWDTWIVPVLGGDAHIWLPNASGLTWTDPHNLLFSEMKPGEGIHMVLVAASESRTLARDVYVPPHLRGMIHRSFLSPDRKSVLMVEMDNGGMGPCRVAPFDGSSSGRRVGPPGSECHYGAWSPDGEWMYLNVKVRGASHIWRERFTGGNPEQITFGPTDETGLWMDPDGRSFVTSLGLEDSRVWVHGPKGEHAISSEGSASIPTGTFRPAHVFSPDGKDFFYLVTRERSANRELWAFHLESGKSERMFPGIAVTGYDVSAEGGRVGFAAPDSSGAARLWVASLDRREPPRQVTALQADNPCFSRDGTLFFRGVEGRFNFVYRIGEGGAARKVTSEPIIALQSCSPDAQWVVAISGGQGEERSVSWAYPSRGGPRIRLCLGCDVVWSRDGRFLYVVIPKVPLTDRTKAYAIQLPEGAALPKLPPEGITVENVSSLPVAKVYNERAFYPGADLSTYAYYRSTTKRNIYRIPVP